ncbi:MAG: uroporphyrinogen decarboxylase family protein [bacterium]
MKSKMTPRENVIASIDFSGPQRLAHDFPEPFGTDFAGMGMRPSPDMRPYGKGVSGVDEWGAVWENIGVCSLGEVKEYPLKDWADFDKLKIPDINDPARWETLEEQRAAAGDKFILSYGVSLYERTHFVRGLEEVWADIYENPDELGHLIDILVDMNLSAIPRFAAAGANGFIFPDDWGLQNRPMISPAKWREIWKPRYKKVWDCCHAYSLKTFMHSCGHIVDLLDDMIDAGLQVVHMDQQENMGLELLGERFGGRLTFYSGVDIQMTLARGIPDEIRAYARKMVKLLGRPEGGILPRWYTDPEGAGHTPEAVEVMCKEFLKISDEMYGN